MKRTPPDQFRAVPLQLDAEAGHQALDGDFFLEPLDLFVRYPRHQISSYPPDWNMTDFPQRLRQLRITRKITQTRVAELLGVSPRVYTRWENGDATPLFGTVVKIADILDVSLDELAGRKETNGDAHIHNPELHRLYKKVDQLSDEDQKALVIVLDMC